jgi:hypothetical protein
MNLNHTKLMHSSTVLLCIWVRIIDEIQNTFSLENWMDVFFRSLISILHKNSKWVSHYKCSKEFFFFFFF